MKNRTLFILTFLTIIPFSSYGQWDFMSIFTSSNKLESRAEAPKEDAELLSQPEEQEDPRVTNQLKRFAEAAVRSTQYQGPIGKDLHRIFTAATQGATPEELQRIYQESNLDGLPLKALPAELAIESNAKIETSTQEIAARQDSILKIFDHLIDYKAQKLLESEVNRKKRKLNRSEAEYEKLNNGSITTALKRFIGFGNISKATKIRTKDEIDYLRIKQIYERQNELFQKIVAVTNGVNRNLSRLIESHPLYEEEKQAAATLKLVVSLFPGLKERD